MSFQDVLPPGLVNVHSSESGSSGGSHNSQEFKKKSSDNKIRRGAEVLRNQLRITENNDIFDTHSSSGDSNDPWLEHEDVLPHQEAENHQNAHYFSTLEDDAEWANLDSDDDDDDEDTVELLKKAALGSLESSPAAAQKASVFPRADEPILDDGNTLASSSYNSSVSSIEKTSYLPGGLLQALPEPRLNVCLPPPRLTRRATSKNTSWQVESCHSHTLDLLKDLQSEEQALTELRSVNREHSLKATQRQENTWKEPSVCDSVVPPCTVQYDTLIKDPGYQHAQRAGTLWQSLVSNHVRFPCKWWNGARSPPMGVAGVPGKWMYTERHRSQAQLFQSMVSNRGSAGRLLLHIVVRDIVTLDPAIDICVGCFHPNARGIRQTSAFVPSLEYSRDVWLALRRRVVNVSLVEPLVINDKAQKSPLGGKHAVNNTNMRAVFGETPPLATIFLVESEIYELFSSSGGLSLPPALVLLRGFLPG